MTHKDRVDAAKALAVTLLVFAAIGAFSMAHPERRKSFGNDPRVVIPFMVLAYLGLMGFLGFIWLRDWVKERKHARLMQMMKRVEELRGEKRFEEAEAIVDEMRRIMKFKKKGD
jgi:hypothetical protein